MARMPERVRRMRARVELRSVFMMLALDEVMEGRTETTSEIASYMPFG